MSREKTISARFAGKCAKCAARIARGETIVYDGRAWHPACYPATSAATTYTPKPKTATTSNTNWLGEQPSPMHTPCDTGGVWRYDSVAQATADWKRVARLPKDGSSSLNTVDIIKDRSDSFYTNSTAPSAVCHALETHDARYVDSVMAALDRIPEQTFEAFVQRWKPGHWGQRLSIGDYTTGAPSMFRRRQSAPDELAPIHVYVDITASGACSADTLAKRGALILAAIERLQMHRAVSLHLVTVMEARYDRAIPTSGNGYIVIDVPSTPISIAELSYPLCDSSFLRMICFSLGAYYHAFSGGWPKDKSVTTHRERLGLAPDDVWLEALHSDNEDLLNTPADWLRTHFGNLLGEPQTLDNVAAAEAARTEINNNDYDYDEVPF